MLIRPCCPFWQAEQDLPKQFVHTTPPLPHNATRPNRSAHNSSCLVVSSLAMNHLKNIASRSQQVSYSRTAAHHTTTQKFQWFRFNDFFSVLPRHPYHGQNSSLLNQEAQFELTTHKTACMNKHDLDLGLQRLITLKQLPPLKWKVCMQSQPHWASKRNRLQTHRSQEHCGHWCLHKKNFHARSQLISYSRAAAHHTTTHKFEWSFLSTPTPPLPWSKFIIAKPRSTIRTQKAQDSLHEQTRRTSFQTSVSSAWLP